VKARSIHYILIGAILTIGFAAATPPACAETCEAVVQRLSHSLTPPLDEEELVSVLRSLNATGNKKLPPQFVTKNQARKLGWKPGRDLWESKDLRGRSIGGDVFGNREKRLPNGHRIWREADLAYKGGKRGPQRIVYSNDGLRMITVDHYRTFKEIPPCQ
jgi:ribonuclease T1